MKISRCFFFLLLPMLLLPGGCAQLPTDLPARPQPAEPSTRATLSALSRQPASSVASSASAAWWQAFKQPALDRLIAQALHRQPDMAMARARLAAAERASQLAALATGLQYQTGMSLTRQRLSDNGLFPTALVGKNYTQTEIHQSVVYDLDVWDRSRALLAATRSEQQAAREDQTAVGLNLAAAVADAYLAWSGVCRLREQMQALQQYHRRILQLTERRRQLGLDAAGPLAEARRRLSLDEETLQQYDYLARSWRYRLAALGGHDPDHADASPEACRESRQEAFVFPALPDNLPLDWLAKRPDIAALKARIEAASARSEAARAAFYPDIDLKLLAGLDTLELSRLFDTASMTGGLGVAIHLPLFNSRTLQAQLGLREADYAAAVASYNRAILEAARQAADAFSLTVNLDQRQEAQARTLAETERLQRLAADRQSLGLSSPLDTLRAEAATLGQRMMTTELQTTRLRARVALFRALGGTSAESLP